MKQTEIRESGTAGQPGEPTASGATVSSPKAETILTSDGIAGLLNSEFAATDTEAEPGAEVQPGEETEQTLQKAEPNEAEADGAEGGSEPELPEGLKGEIERWEAAGGGELPKPLQALVERRIGKLTGQRETEKKAREEAETKLAAVETELAELKLNPGAAAAPAVGGISNEKDLAKLEQTTRRFLEDAENYIDDTATDAERERIGRYLGENRMDLKGLKRSVRELQTYVSVDLPQQKAALAKFRDQERAAEPEARKWFPWLQEKSSPEYQQAQVVLSAMPELRTRTPLHQMVLGVYVLGLKEFERLRGQTVKPVAVKKAPPKAPTTGSAAPAIRANGQQAEEEAARAEFGKRLDRESAAKLLAIGLR